jgi:hypothetical protein
MGVVMSGSPVLIPRYAQKSFNPDGTHPNERDTTFQQLCSLVVQIVDYEKFQRSGHLKRKYRRILTEMH